MAVSDTALARLPAGVRNHIAKLEADCKYWRAKAQDGPDTSNTFADGTPENNERYGLGCTPLGMDREVVFVLPEGTISARIEYGAVSLRASGSKYIAALPRSANTLSVVPTSGSITPRYGDFQ